jgi:hypothetical protein
MVYCSTKEHAKTNFVRRRAEAPRIHNARGQRKMKKAHGVGIRC